MGKRFLASKMGQAKANGDKFRRLSMAYALGVAKESPKTEVWHPTESKESKAERRLARIARKAARQQNRLDRKKSRRQRAKHFTEGYLQYIKSDAWFQFRATIFAERGRQCEQCQRTDCELHLHHLTYRNLGNEKPKDVKILCRTCHEALHKHMKVQ